MARRNSNGRAKKDSFSSDDDLSSSRGSSSKGSIISQAPLTEAGESTQERRARKRNRMPTTRYEPDPRPDIIILREAAALQTLEENQPLKNGRKKDAARARKIPNGLEGNLEGMALSMHLQNDTHCDSSINSGERSAMRQPDRVVPLKRNKSSKRQRKKAGEEDSSVLFVFSNDESSEDPSFQSRRRPRRYKKEAFLAQDEKTLDSSFCGDSSVDDKGMEPPSRFTKRAAVEVQKASGDSASSDEIKEVVMDSDHGKSEAEDPEAGRKRSVVRKGSRPKTRGSESHGDKMKLRRFANLIHLDDEDTSTEEELRQSQLITPQRSGGRRGRVEKTVTQQTYDGGNIGATSLIDSRRVRRRESASLPLEHLSQRALLADSDDQEIDIESWPRRPSHASLVVARPHPTQENKDPRSLPSRNRIAAREVPLNDDPESTSSEEDLNPKKQPRKVPQKEPRYQAKAIDSPQKKARLEKPKVSLGEEGERGHSPTQGLVASTKVNVTENRMILTDELDDISAVACQAAFARLELVDTKTAVSFCQSCLKEYYSNAKLALRAFIADSSPANESVLISQRKTIVGLWCTYARVLIEATDTVPTPGRGKMKPKHTHTFAHLTEREAAELRLLLLDFALMILSQAVRCPIAGNHAWIGLLYSRIVLAANKGQPDSNPSDSDKHRSMKAAGAICKQALGNLTDAEPYFDQQLIDQLVQFGVVEKEATASVWQMMEDVKKGDTPMVLDGGSALLLSAEVGMLQSLQNGVECVTWDNHNASQDSVASLFQLPVPSEDTGMCLQFHQRLAPENSSQRRSSQEVQVSSDRSSGGDDVDQPAGECFCDVEMADGTTCGARDRRARSFNHDFSLPPMPNFKNHGKGGVCEDVLYLCPFCDHPGFASKAERECHASKCDQFLTGSTSSRAVVPPIVAFGGSRLIGDWSVSSLDPENGPLPSPDELLDVLGYSVEIFEVEDSEVPRNHAASYSLKSPHVSGQLGLRCQYCDQADALCPGVFPESVGKLPQAMWYLSLTHLDECPCQPRHVRHWHDNYRRNVRFDSFVDIEYWANVAAELKIAPIEGGGLIRAQLLQRPTKA